MFPQVRWHKPLHLVYWPNTIPWEREKSHDTVQFVRIWSYSSYMWIHSGPLSHPPQTQVVLAVFSTPTRSQDGTLQLRCELHRIILIFTETGNFLKLTSPPFCPAESPPADAPKKGRHVMIKERRDVMTWATPGGSDEASLLAGNFLKVQIS